MKHIIERNFKFWFWEAQKAVGIMTAFGVAYTFLFNVLSKQSINYMQMVLLVFPLCLPMSYVKSYIPMLISFGSLRKECAIGFQIMNIFSVAEIIIIGKIFSAIMANYIDVISLPFLTVIGLSICSISVSQIIGSIGLKFSYSIMLIGIIILAVLAAGASAFLLISQRYTEFALFRGNGVNIILLVTGAVLYIISIFVVHIIIKKYEVKNA